tara:strand:- start:718 stop:1476 length:759 start_codon:yes stop_codon:yes gene_type:complete
MAEEETTQQTVADVTNAVEAEPTEEKDFVVAEDSAPERPEWLPEKYKTPKEFVDGYTSLQQKFHQKETDMKEAWEKELHDEAFKDRPASAGDYTLPEIIDQNLAPDNKLLNWWSEMSWNNGLSQDEFEAGIQAFKESNENKLGILATNKEEEITKLGDNAPERLEAVALFAEKFFPDNVMPAIHKVTETAEGVQAIEHIMQTVKTNTIQTEPANKLDRQALESMMDDDRYWHPVKRDSEYRRQVDEGFEKLG